MTLHDKAEWYLLARLRGNWESQIPVSGIIVTREIWFSRLPVAGIAVFVSVLSDDGLERMRNLKKTERPPSTVDVRRVHKPEKETSTARKNVYFDTANPNFRIAEKTFFRFVKQGVALMNQERATRG
jgi:hypothetical protein